MIITEELLNPISFRLEPSHKQKLIEISKKLSQ